MEKSKMKIKKQIEIDGYCCDICSKEINNNFSISFIEHLCEYLCHTDMKDYFFDLENIDICEKCASELDKKFSKELNEFIKNFININKLEKNDE